MLGSLPGRRARRRPWISRTRSATGCCRSPDLSRDATKVTSPVWSRFGSPIPRGACRGWRVWGRSPHTRRPRRAASLVQTVPALDDDPTASARRRPRGGSNAPHLIDNQAASPDAYEGKKQRSSVRCSRRRLRGGGHPLSRPTHTVYNCHLRLVNLSFHSLALSLF